MIYRDILDTLRFDRMPLLAIVCTGAMLWSSVALAGPKPQLNSVVSTTAAEGEEEEVEEKSPISVSLSVSTSVGIGAFHPGAQQQTAVSTGITPSLSYSLGDGLSLKTSIGGSWYQVLDYETSLEKDKFLFTDMYFQLGHSKVYSNEDLGLTIGATFRAYLPTSLSSQLQNRILTIRPGLNMSWSFGPVSVSSFVIFAKYFNTSSDRSINCDTYQNEDECREGRGDDEDGMFGGFESEQNGGEVYLPSAGVNSFYIGYNFGVNWTITEGLNLSTGLTMYHLFGYKSFSTTEGISSQYASSGRNQVDRLIASIGLSYQLHKNLGLSLGLATDTARPFGADGKDLVILAFDRGNITSLSFGINGSL